MFEGISGNGSPIIPEITRPPQFDEWGLPVVTAEQSASVAGAMGLPPPIDPNAPKPPSVTEQDAKVKEIQERRKKTAKSLAELMGHGYTAAIVMGSTRFVKSTGREPVKPSPKQCTDLAECTKDTITEMFGDHEVKPWIMMVMLSIGIPLSMWIQSPKVKQQLPQSPEQSTGLRAVPQT
jgi:hypothetical protein